MPYQIIALAALELIQTLVREQRPPTAEEEARLNAAIAQAHAEMIGKLDTVQ